MNKKEKLRIIEILNNIKYELSEGTHTYTMCECGRTGCRGSKCWKCLSEMLL